MVQVEVIDMARRVVNLPVMTPQGAQAIPVPFVAWFNFTAQLMQKLAAAEQVATPAPANKILTGAVVTPPLTAEQVRKLADAARDRR
jgi:hypothetical protein